MGLSIRGQFVLFSIGMGVGMYYLIYLFPMYTPVTLIANLFISVKVIENYFMKKV